MDHIITQTRGQAFETLVRAFQALVRAFKISRVFQKLESSDQRAYKKLVKIWSVKGSLHISNKSPELETKLQISAFSFEIFHSV